MHKYLWTLAIFCTSLFGFVSCSETEDTDTEYADWQSRNEMFFHEQMKKAKDSIALAKRTYGNDWEAHCNWRTYLSYSLEDTVVNKVTDSICVQIVRRGTGQGYPFISDSVRVNYRGLLMPTMKYPKGYVFDHSGPYSDFDRVFDRQIAVPSTFKASACVRGFATALLYMRPGDFWRVYIPHPLGYGMLDNNKVPAYSTLIFEIDLYDFYRAGTKPPVWS